MRTLVGQLLLPAEDGVCETRLGRVHLQDDTIAEVEFLPESESIDEGTRSTLICPGFVDAHLHLPQFDSIGAAGMPLLPWLNEVIFPAEIRWNDEAFAQGMIDRVLRQCLAVGTTAVCAYSTVSYEATLCALRAFGAVGFRGVIGQALMDCGAPEPLLRPTAQLIDQLGETLRQFPPSDRLATAVTPRYVLACTPDLLSTAADLARGHNALMQTHLAENVDECAAVEQEYGNYVDAYDRHGLLSERSIFAHGIHLSEQDREKLASKRSIIAHCPTANQFLSSGTMNRERHVRANVPLVLGSDIGAGYERSMVRVGRGMIEAAMRVAEEQSSSLAAVPSGPEAWFQITTGNANTLGWQDIGRIQVGASADLVVIRPDVPWQSTRCPLSTLMWSWDDRWVAETILQGNTAYSSAANT